MAVPIGIMQLAGDSRRFVFDNISILIDHLRIIFPAIALVELINSFAGSFGAPWLMLFTVPMTVYLYACLALSWHRTSILEPSSEHAINPFEIKPENKGFIKFFLIFSFAPIIVGVIYGAIVGAIGASGAKGLVAVMVILGVGLLIYGVIYLMRISFVLPAKAVGMKMSLEEAKQASKGLVWKVLAAGILMGLVYVLIVFAYALVAGLIFGNVFEPDTENPVMGGIVGFFVNIPILAGGLVLTAINITILSKAFQWRVQNG